MLQFLQVASGSEAYLGVSDGITMQGRFFYPAPFNIRLSSEPFLPSRMLFLALQDITGQVRNNYYATNAGAGKMMTSKGKNEKWPQKIKDSKATY